MLATTLTIRCDEAGTAPAIMYFRIGSIKWAFIWMMKKLLVRQFCEKQKDVSLRTPFSPRGLTYFFLCSFFCSFKSYIVNRIEIWYEIENQDLSKNRVYRAAKWLPRQKLTLLKNKLFWRAKTYTPNTVFFPLSVDVSFVIKLSRLMK
jgi:hypothetical protein